jgi:hypothetical protein
VRDLDRVVAYYRDNLGFAVEEIDPGRNAFRRSAISSSSWRTPTSTGSS